MPTTLEHLNMPVIITSACSNGCNSSLTSEALLLFDEINRKGFEGDTLLEGFAEFTRNVLVSKDMESGNPAGSNDDFKPEIPAACPTGVNPAGWSLRWIFLTKPSSITNKAAIKNCIFEWYSLARLHLQQAVQLVADEQGVKKLVDTTKAVSFGLYPWVN